MNDIQKRPVAPITPEERQRLESAKRYIESHAHRGFDGGVVRAAAASIGMSPYHFHRRFHLCFEETPKAVATRCQIDLAKKLLLDGEELLKIAERCGFAHQSHFAWRFRVMVGEAPTRWLKWERRSREKNPTIAA